MHSRGTRLWNKRVRAEQIIRRAGSAAGYSFPSQPASSLLQCCSTFGLERREPSAGAAGTDRDTAGTDWDAAGTDRGAAGLRRGRP